MLPRVLEPEVMDTPEEARDYDAMDHAVVNRAFVTNLLAVWDGQGFVLDVGTGTAQVPIELCRRANRAGVVAIDLADHMLALARANVERAGLAGRIQLVKMDAKWIYYHPGAFPAVMSNAFVHHIADPFAVFEGMHQACRDGGTLFVRDLLRPADEVALRHIVDTYAAGATDHQRRMFAASLRAALTLDEVRGIVGRLGYPPESVQQTSDRHWTFSAYSRG